MESSFILLFLSYSVSNALANIMFLSTKIYPFLAHFTYPTLDKATIIFALISYPSSLLPTFPPSVYSKQNNYLKYIFDDGNPLSKFLH